MERIGVAPGTEIGGYRVLAPLGAGGMGAVYRAVDGHGTVVALKLLHPHLGSDPDARERLSREVSNLQRVRHPGVARVLDAEIDSAEAFIVTELVDGEDLAARVRARGPVPPWELADLAEQLRAALVVVHGAGVLHRDLTPANVLVTDRGPVLIDFGIAQAADDARVTSTGLVVGTPGYLSPELLEGGEPSEAGDWWGWAALLAFAATGRPPFGVRPLHSVLARARAGDADLAGLDPRTTAALRSALAVEPHRRAGPEAVVEHLRRAAEGDVQALAGGDAGTGTAVLGSSAGTQVLGAEGGTRVMPTGVRHPWEVADGPAGQPGAPDAEDGNAEGRPDSEYGQGGYRDDEYADDEYGDEPYGDDEPPVFVPPEPRRRVGTLLALSAVVVAAGAVRPGAALAAAVAAAVLVRWVGLAVGAVQVRRARRGRRRGDLARALAISPWHLVRAALGVLPGALMAASVVVVVGGVGWWLVGTGRLVIAPPAPGDAAGELAGNAAWVTPVVLGAAVLVGLLALWFGPMSRATRVGARWTLRAVAPGWPGAVTLTVLALAATWLLVTAVLEGEPTVWWPLPGPPDLR